MVKIVLVDIFYNKRVNKRITEDVCLLLIILLFVCDYKICFYMTY